MNETKTQLPKKEPSFAYASLVLVTIAIIMVCGIRIFQAPLAVVMFLSWLIVNFFAHFLGYTYPELETIAIDTIRNSIQAVIIMLGVGVLILSLIHI